MLAHTPRISTIRMSSEAEGSAGAVPYHADGEKLAAAGPRKRDRYLNHPTTRRTSGKGLMALLGGGFLEGSWAVQVTRRAPSRKS